MNPKRLLEIARKWQKMAALGRRRISMARTSACSNAGECSSTSVAEKGHFVVYTMEGKRFMVPLEYLQSSIFLELFRISEEEIGLPVDGPITLPCEATSMEYVMLLLRKRVSKDMERTLLTTIVTPCHASSSSLQHGLNQPLVVCSF